ncbi:transcriptional regulator [Halobacteria archaeon AArc-dxtr1]|nr:transcriptional regulator [Halobacteria archaeon AArc-dxtr1]
MHTCRDCNRSFSTELDLELHRDTCERAELFCGVCGNRFREVDATRDGWHYTCPADDCDAEGIENDLGRVEELRPASR